jgi:hypothetical protein
LRFDETGGACEKAASRPKGFPRMTSLSPFDQGRNMPAGADALQQELRAALERGENILWSGYPAQGIRFVPQDAFMIPFSLLWGGFAITWETTAVAGGAPFLFALWGIPFVLMGLYMIFGRFLADARTRANTIYAVTDQRVIILSGLFARSLRSLELPGLAEINSTEKPDGSGTIAFGAVNPFSAMRGWPGMNRTATNPAFEGIARMRDVLKTIRDAQRAAVRGSGS